MKNICVVLLVFCIVCSQQNFPTGKRDETNLITTFFLYPARFSFPFSLAFDSQGDLYLSDATVIRRIARGYVSTAVAWLYPASPLGLVFRDDNLYIADGYGLIRKIFPDGPAVPADDLTRPGYVQITL